MSAATPRREIIIEQQLLGLLHLHVWAFVNKSLFPQ